MYVASNTTANNFELHRSAAKNVINLTSKYVIPGLFDMHAHVAYVLKNSYNGRESEYMFCTP
jgi:predicted amidohydrolase YtcJ